MNDLDELSGKHLAVILVRDDTNEKAVLTGTVERQGDRYVLKGEDFSFPLSPRLPELVRWVENPRADFLDGAVAFVVQTVKPLTPDIDPDTLSGLGLKWPSDQKDSET